MSDNLAYYLGFSYCEGIGPTKFDVLIRAFGTVATAYQAPQHELTTYLGAKLASRFVVFRNSFDAQKEIESITQSGITVLTREHIWYPPQLKNIFDPPICLYVKGDVSLYDWEKDLFIAIVGTRKPSDYGRQISVSGTPTFFINGLKIVGAQPYSVFKQIIDEELKK